MRSKGEDMMPGRGHVQVNLDATPEWREWIRGLSRHEDRPVATIVRRAVRSYAERAGYRESPPEK